jgi:carbon monoxide dehydrogenase subunit G
MTRLLPVVFAALLLSSSAEAADPTKPHGHTGLIAPYKGAPPVPTVSAADAAILAKGDAVLQQVKNEGGGGRGIAIQDIHADNATVWSKITDYNKYATMVEGVKECGTYEKAGDHIKARFVITAMFMNIEYYVDHVYKPADNWMTWTLDYTRESDLDDSVGFWRSSPVPDKPGWTRVFYSVEVRLKGWVPAMVENMVAKSGLTQATGWVKRESEKAAGAKP